MTGQKFSEGKLPLYTVIAEQFPLAFKEVAKCSKAGNQKYKLDTDWQNFKRVPNAVHQYRNAALRHMLEEGKVEDMEEFGGMTHKAATIWNLLAALQIELEQENNK